MKNLESRIKKRLAELGMQAKDLFPLVGLSDQSALNKIYNRNSARHETLVKIANALNISLEELTGETVHKSNVRVVTNYKTIDLPYVPVNARAGFVASVLYDTPIMLETYTVLITDYNEDLTDNYVFEVDGDSMEPYYWAKMKLRVKKINSNDWEFIPSGVYLVLYRNEYLVLKRVKSNTMQISGDIKLYSDNAEMGGELTLKKVDINCIWRVLSIVYAPAR